MSAIYPAILPKKWLNTSIFNTVNLVNPTATNKRLPNKILVNFTKITTLAAVVSLTACATHQASQKVDPPVYVNGIPSYYVVQNGDTLSHIASRYRLDYRKIAALNGLDSNYKIYAGQHLKLFTVNNRPTTATTMPKPPAQNTNQFPITTPPVYTQTPVIAPMGTAQKNWLRPVNGSVVRGFANDGSSKGVWYGAAMGSPVIATQAGTVLYAGDKLTEYGNLIMLRHDNDYVSAYTHLGKMLVQEGQTVQAGQQIGSVGMSNGQPMTQFQVRYRGAPVNPANFIK